GNRISFENQESRRHAVRNHQEARLRPRLRLHRSRGWQGVLLPPQRHRGRLRQPQRGREGHLRDRGEPQGPAREPRQGRVRLLKPEEDPAPKRRGVFFCPKETCPPSATTSATWPSSPTSTMARRRWSTPA